MALIFLFASALISFAFFAAADKPIKSMDITKEKITPPKRIDADKNKIFDDLEEKLKGKNDNEIIKQRSNLLLMAILCPISIGFKNGS